MTTAVAKQGIMYEVVGVRWVHCVKCDRQYQIEVNYKNQAVNPLCPSRRCGCSAYSIVDISSMHKLIEENLGSAHFVANRVGRRFGDNTIRMIGGMDELCCQCMVYLLKAAQRYDPSYRQANGKPVKFITYAVVSMEQDLNQWMGTQLKTGEIGTPTINDQGYVIGCLPRLSLSFNSVEYGTDYEFEDTKATDPSIWDGNDQILRDSLLRLPKLQSRILHLRFWDYKTLAEIGILVGLTKERVRQLQAIALTKLNRILQGDDKKRASKQSKGQPSYNTEDGGEDE